MNRVRRALLSVSDKAGIVELAKGLQELNVDILSTGGTARLLTDQGVKVEEVSDFTGFPEIMGGRVKTLHPKIHGGILGRRDVDASTMKAHEIQPIDLLVVNLYPFQQTVADPDCDLITAIENIDIGGPAMLRAAAKNHKFVTVVVDSGDYALVLEDLLNYGNTTELHRFALATKVFEHTARYDGAIANYLGARQDVSTLDVFPRTLSMQFIKHQEMRYGENPHQAAALYRDHVRQSASVANAQLLQGKALSYNNILDADTALECVKTFSDSLACVIVKHANPCGVAVGESLIEAYNLAFQTDPTSAFGGIIAFSQEVDRDLAKQIIQRQFVEVIIAPSFSDSAARIMASKPNVRLLSTGPFSTTPVELFDFKRVGGGLLIQEKDCGDIAESDLRIVSRRSPTKSEMTDLLFAWRVVKFVKSNAIVYCKGQQTIGIGAGQMSRVYSARIAAIKAEDENLEVSGSVMASDAFFPFRDGIDAAGDVGITAVIQPGGSMKDGEVIEAADEHNIAMVFTGIRHFRH